MYDNYYLTELCNTTIKYKYKEFVNINIHLNVDKYTLEQAKEYKEDDYEFNFNHLKDYIEFTTEIEFSSEVGTQLITLETQPYNFPGEAYAMAEDDALHILKRIGINKYNSFVELFDTIMDTEEAVKVQDAIVEKLIELAKESN